MMIQGMLSNCAVADSAAAEEWYSRLLDRGPDARPMPGLLEWHLGETFGIQIWVDPERAGNSVVVLRESDLAEVAARLTAVGIDHPGVQPGGGARILTVPDPDGNSVIFFGS